MVMMRSDGGEEGEKGDGIDGDKPTSEAWLGLNEMALRDTCSQAVSILKGKVSSRSGVQTRDKRRNQEKSRPTQATGTKQSKRSDRSSVWIAAFGPLV